jgi:hypothetical protein
MNNGKTILVSDETFKEGRKQGAVDFCDKVY